MRTEQSPISFKATTKQKEEYRAAATAARLRLSKWIKRALARAIEAERGKPVQSEASEDVWMPIEMTDEEEIRWTAAAARAGKGLIGWMINNMDKASGFTHQ